MSDHHHHGHASHRTDDAAQAEMLDLDGEVLRSYWSQALDWVQQAAGDSASTVLDLGAGTGNGSIGLAQRFPTAVIIAVDAAPEMLARIRDKARGLGLDSRIRTVHADLDGPWPIREPVDLTWASMSLHHLADPDRVLGDVAAGTSAGGLLAVAEFVEDLRFLPDDIGIGRPGLESRCLAAAAEEHTHSLPHLGSDWASRLDAAGFAVLDEREFTIALGATDHPHAARYAALTLQHLRAGLADRLDHDDRQALDALLDREGPQNVQQRTDLQIRGTRTVTVARPA